MDDGLSPPSGETLVEVERGQAVPMLLGSLWIGQCLRVVCDGVALVRCLEVHVGQYDGERAGVSSLVVEVDSGV